MFDICERAGGSSRDQGPFLERREIWTLLCHGESLQVLIRGDRNIVIHLR